jgi:hypothetical protein
MDLKKIVQFCHVNDFDFSLLSFSTQKDSFKNYVGDYLGKIVI